MGMHLKRKLKMSTSLTRLGDALYKGGVYIPPHPPLIDDLAVFIGGSQSQNNNLLTSTPTTTPRLFGRSIGQFLVGNAMAGAPLRLLTAYETTNYSEALLAWRGSNMGIGGKTIRSFQEGFHVTEASAAKHVILNMDRNGIPQITFEETTTRYIDICQRARRQGRIVWHGGLFARAAWVPGDPSWTMLVALDTWLRAYAADNDEVYIDFNEKLRDPGGPEFYTVQGDIYYDGTHFNEKGAWLASNAVTEALQSVFGATWGTLDTSAPNNKFPVPLWNGTGGTVGAGVTGTCPPGLQITKTASGTVGVSAQTVTRAGITQYEVTITPTGVAGAYETISLGDTANNTGISGVGRYVELAIGRVEVEGDASALIAYSPRLSGNVSNAALRLNLPRTTTGLYNPPQATAYYQNYGQTVAHMSRQTGMVFEMRSGQGLADFMLDITVDPASTTPFKIYTSEWVVREVDMLGMFPEYYTSADTATDPSG